MCVSVLVQLLTVLAGAFQRYTAHAQRAAVRMAIHMSSEKKNAYSDADNEEADCCCRWVAPKALSPNRHSRVSNMPTTHSFDVPSAMADAYAPLIHGEGASHRAVCYDIAIEVGDEH